MNRKLLIAAVAILGLISVAERWWVKPVLAQVRAALTQSVDEPGRNPFAFYQVTLGPGEVSFPVPVGKRYVVDAFTATCDVKKHYKSHRHHAERLYQRHAR